MNNNRIATKTKDMDIKRGKHYWEVYNQRKDSKITPRPRREETPKHGQDRLNHTGFITGY